VYWLDADARWFPQPAIVYAFARGVTKPTASTSRVSGIGQAFSPELRAQLAPQFVDHLARIHSFDPAKRDLSAFNVPRTGSTESAEWQLNRARRVWDEDRGHDLPLFDVATNWLARNLPELDRASMLHGDFRAGNFLFDESNGQILTWLDWERGYIGDRHRDLAWTTTRTFGNYAEDGKTFLVSGLIPIDDFFELYEKKSGLSVDMDRIRFYRVLNSYQLMVSALASAYRLVRLGKTHQDVLLAWVEAVGYAMAEDIRQVLSEEFNNAE
jgi:aminoglycoside phosphotransferase (APT) family kinase protein